MSSSSVLRPLIAAGVLTIACAATAAAADPFTLTSSTFKDGQLMPRKVANNTANNPAIHRHAPHPTIDPICFASLIRQPLSTGLDTV